LRDSGRPSAPAGRHGQHDDDTAHALDHQHRLEHLHLKVRQLEVRRQRLVALRAAQSAARLRKGRAVSFVTGVAAAHRCRRLEMEKSVKEANLTPH
jgi:hypothetical protein